MRTEAAASAWAAHVKNRWDLAAPDEAAALLKLLERATRDAAEVVTVLS
jgi:hypothetical protein